MRAQYCSTTYRRKSTGTGDKRINKKRRRRRKKKEEEKKKKRRKKAIKHLNECGENSESANASF
jgi:hypothetical protein